ncbi:MAG: restriction endonuclease subunit R [Verrucomicrobia bacterium]|nr:MAG: restriction endonuclease subunit R [Verrucomicrobiota bacterium]
MPARRRTTSPPLPFDKKLVLQQWILSLLQAEDIYDLCDEEFRHPDAESWDTENVTEFHHLLTRYTVERPQLSNAMLRAFDQNIVRHTLRINGRRKQPIRWKYYQYVALLFTEIYLHWYFNRPSELLIALNAQVQSFNTEQVNESDKIEPYTAGDLKKLCFWQATGSGKTLQMHVNILQYLDHLEKAGRRNELNKIILLTPKEGLSIQHLKEFGDSGIDAELFDKDGSGVGALFSGQTVEIIDVNKLADDSKEKTVAVDCFEGNNLVLVDEGHRGSSGEEWMRRREALCRDGFSFEYSATFGQSVKAAKDKAMEQNYARWILFDYSYRFFHKDGYGKHYRILNLKEQKDDGQRQLYLTAALLAFYQQLRAWEEHREEFAAFNVERPLWVFFGAKVNAGEISDIVSVLMFFAEFTKNRSESIRRLDLVLEGRDDMMDRQDRSLFADAFPYLKKLNLDGAAAFEDILRRVFNSASGGKIHVVNLKGSQGELSLRLGISEPFGVINVGDEKKLHDLCSEHTELLVTSDQEFGDSLFHNLSNVNSKVHLLLGSKKFTEGWNSWRVSSIGLMNMGRSEGSDVIQLFGRGVRLKGWDMTLKRSEALKRINLEIMQRATDAQRRFLPLVETLSVFGVRADYMDQFREYLETEGIQTDSEWEDIIVPSLPTLSDLPSKKLKIVRVPENLNYKRDAPRPRLVPEKDYFKRFPVKVDWYPRIEALKATGQTTAALQGKRDEGTLSAHHLAFIDREAIYLRLQQFKTERGYSNLRIDREQIDHLLSDSHWYTLHIPQEELEPSRFDRVRTWQQVAEALLMGYCERIYKYRKQAWESEHATVFELGPDDPNFVEEYTFRVQREEEALIEQLKDLSHQVGSPTFKKFAFAKVFAMRWENHLYSPLIHIDGNTVVEVSPVSLNLGEWQFVHDLKNHHNAHPDFFKGKELYLLRNRSKKGIGFFEAGNFYPDFILWLIVGKTQYVVFVDPKGLLHTQGFDDPKIAFAEKIKELEVRLKPENPDLVLDSFIISTTSFKQIHWWDKLKTEEDFAKVHVLLQKDESATYIGKMFELITKEKAALSK